MKLLTFIACTLISISSYSQNFKKDLRPDSVKEDFMDNYQAGQISKVDLLHALNSLGVRIFNCQLLPRFTKSYKLTVDVDEFLNGKMINTRNVSPNENNIYFFWEDEKQYADFANKIRIITRDADSVSILSVDIMGNSTGMKLKKHIDRKNQWYDWRRFSETNWTLNTKILYWFIHPLGMIKSST